MYAVNVIPSRCWKNMVTGQTVSLYGSVPYLSEAEKDNWEVVEKGYTTENSNGTVGGMQCINSSMSREEVVERVNKWNARLKKPLVV